MSENLDAALEAELKQYIANVENGTAKAEPEQAQTQPEVESKAPSSRAEEPAIEDEGTAEEAEETAEESQDVDEDADIDAIVKRKIQAEPETLPENVQKKIGREVAKRKATEEHNAKMAARLREMEQQLENLKKGSSNVDAENTLRSPIDDLMMSPIEAARKARAEELAAEKKAREIAAYNAELKKLAQHATDSAEAFAEQVPDYHDAVQAGLLPVIDDRLDIMQELARADNFAEIAYFLAQPKQKQLLRDLTEMNEVDLIRRVARLDEQFRIAHTKASKTAAPKPKPLSKVGTGANASKRVEDMDAREFEKWFQSQ